MVCFLFLNKSKYLHGELYCKEYEIVTFTSNLSSDVLLSFCWGRKYFHTKITSKMLEISVTKTKRIHSSIQTKGIKESHQIKFFKFINKFRKRIFI